MVIFHRFLLTFPSDYPEVFFVGARWISVRWIAPMHAPSTSRRMALSSCEGGIPMKQVALVDDKIGKTNF